MAKIERIESAGESPPPQPTTSDSKPESELPLFTVAADFTGEHCADGRRCAAAD